jgi:hypothetical protein
MIGVERTDMSSRAKAAVSNTVRGVAGLNIARSAKKPCRRDERRLRRQRRGEEDGAVKLAMLNVEYLLATRKRL